MITLNEKLVIKYCCEDISYILNVQYLDQGAFVQVNIDKVGDKIEGFKLIDLSRWLALSRIDPYWMEPFYGSCEKDIPKETQFLLWERNDGLYGILLPLVDNEIRSTLVGTDKGVTLDMGGTFGDYVSGIGRVMYLGIGNNPYDLTCSAMKEVAERLGTFRLREQKTQPDFSNYLGWCTWDAFYHTVDYDKVMDGLESFRKGGISPGFMILDDGWLDTEGDFLNNMKANIQKFPDGLGPMIKKAKEEYGIQYFGIWHAFEGYWAGVKPSGEMGQRYSFIPTTGVIRPWEDKLESLYMIHPKDIMRFYHDFYDYLRKEGVDMVKVDGQSALEIFTEGEIGRCLAMHAYQEAFQSAALYNFSTNAIHCMSNGSDVAYNMMSTVVWRNSRDYFPERPVEMQQKHIQINTMNNVWTSTFSSPDWDMFQTHTEEGEFHAAARAISGGTVYVCDKPHKQDFKLIRKLITSDGKLLKCDRPALPARDCLFVDCYRLPKLLKITNRSGEIGLLGMFHCQENGGIIKDTFSPADVEDIAGQTFIAYFHKSGKVAVLKREEKVEIELSAMEYEIVTLSPLSGAGIAPLGLLDKFNGGAAIESWEVTQRGSHIFHLRDGSSQIGFFSKTSPHSIYINGIKTNGSYDEGSGLLLICAEQGQRLQIEIDIQI